jgi:hypothetical protein
MRAMTRIRAYVGTTAVDATYLRIIYVSNRTRTPGMLLRQ